MTMAQFTALAEVQRESQKGEPTPQEGNEADWAMLATLPMGS